MLVQCNNITCKKLMDVRLKQDHIKIYHPNFLSIARSTDCYPELNRFMTPREIIKNLFEVITQ